MHRYAGDFAVTREDFASYFGWYLSRPQDRTDPYAMPGFATDLAGLPPTVITIAGFDPLRSAEEAYAERLRAAGVPVVLQSDPSLIHGWLDFFPRVPAAAAALDHLVGAVRDLITQARSTTPTAGAIPAGTTELGAYPTPTTATAEAAVAIQEVST